MRLKPWSFSTREPKVHRRSDAKAREDIPFRKGLARSLEIGALAEKRACGEVEEEPATATNRDGQIKPKADEQRDTRSIPERADRCAEVERKRVEHLIEERNTVRAVHEHPAGKERAQFHTDGDACTVLAAPFRRDEHAGGVEITQTQLKRTEGLSAVPERDSANSSRRRDRVSVEATVNAVTLLSADRLHRSEPEYCCVRVPSLPHREHQQAL